MTSDITIVKICEVVWIDDDTDGNRIKVRLTSDDYQTPVEDLPYAIPFLPQMLHIKPKLHEAVLIMNAVANNGHSQRYYIGPLISQINHIYEEPLFDATNQFDTSTNVKDPSELRDVNKTAGATPKDDEIAIVGRKFSDVILADNDIRIRCGAKKIDTLQPKTFSFNATDSAYMKLKYYEDGLPGVENCKSTATIVADKVNLIGNKSNDRAYYSANDPNEFINDENMARLINSAHALPYGDKLVEFLTLFREVFMEHTHPFPMLPPCQPENFVNLGKYNLKQMLSDSVAIN